MKIIVIGLPLEDKWCGLSEDDVMVVEVVSIRPLISCLCVLFSTGCDQDLSKILIHDSILNKIKQSYIKTI